MRLRIYDVVHPVDETPGAPDRAWWQSSKPREFTARIDAMPIKDLERLKGELSGALSFIQSQLETRREPGDEEWQNRARRSLGHIARLNNIVKAAITAHNERSRTENEARRAVYIGDARSRLESGDVAGAVSVVLDLMEGAHARKT